MDSDEDFQRALALSLQDTQATRKAKAKADVIVIDDSDDENDINLQSDREFEESLRKAVEESKLESSQPSPPRRDTSSPDIVEGAPPPAEIKNTDPSTSSFLSERAQLERERLARQKRHLSTSQSFQESEPPLKKSNKRESSPPPKRALPYNATASTSQNSNQGPEMFWDGAIRQTANIDAEKDKDHKPVFRLSDILAPTDELAFAIISTYALDIGWLYSLFPPSVPVILVTQPDPSGNASIHAMLPNWIKTTPFLRNGYGAMHCKLLLLFYKSGRLRIALPTANFVPYDWRDIENTVWVQDIPPKKNPQGHSARASDFSSILQRVLIALQVRQALRAHIVGDHPNLPLQSIEDLGTRWDWSKVKVHLIPCMAGKYEGWPEVLRNGHTRLMKAIREANARAGPNRDVMLECQGSSVGTYSTQWLNEFFHSGLGESAQQWLDQPKARRSKLAFPPVKIIFPSLKTVRASRGGELGGGTMFCRRSQWSGAKFPRELFHDSNSKRGGILMHSKMIIATFKPKAGLGFSSKAKGKSRRKNPYSSEEEEQDEDEVKIVEEGIDETVCGWAYVGSANFTPSAWGTLSGSAFNPVLNITNYELGVLLPLRSEAEANDIACFERPPRKYDLKEDVPWMQDESAILAQAI
ncbi:phospholipase D/nuclease [Sistotremastrum niveocremeum HHB9708]|uniref:Phospholipase D/nuclease n=1 Tax=Sistotremastrum niveocremeum HHB9708 TaxID=1314777 RepID=A0A164QD13_9AGAM|nr:phospholipase D/nuclease [Sistotremastrum niveocremeum HHB9708]